MSRAAHDVINLGAMTEEVIRRGTWTTITDKLNSSHSRRFYHIDAAYHAHSEKLPQDGPDLVDGSGPLFSLYLGMAEEEDRKMAESWKADADGILVFVSPHVVFHNPPPRDLKLKFRRRVYSLPLSQHSSRSQFRTFNRTPKTSPRFTSLGSTNCSQMPAGLPPPFRPHFLTHLSRSFRQGTPFGSTRSGS